MHPFFEEVFGGGFRGDSAWGWEEGRVFFGAWVEIENEDGQKMSFKIVGPDEIYKGAKDWISIDSPMARALIKKEEGDDVLVSTPSGPVEWVILRIDYMA